MNKHLLSNNARRALLLCGALSLTACTHTARKRNAVQQKLDAHSQALTTAIVDTLQAEPALPHDPPTALALELAREDQRIEGLPDEPIPVATLLASNMPASAEARAELADRFTHIRSLLQRQRDATARLVEQGVIHEQQTNARRVRWFKWISSTSILLGGAVALCVFFPVALPILGRLFAWVVAKIPSLASYLGVVSVRAFDAIVRGIENSRGQSKPDVQLPNDSARGTSSQPENPMPLALLELNLSRAMDHDHKGLVRSRIASLAN